jgi:hypothetical protein
MGMRAIMAGSASGRRFAVVLVAFALAMRLLVPIGWMPSADGRSITLCTGMGMVEAWVDAKGDLHEKAPLKPVKAGEPCTFAALAAALVVPDAMPTLAVPEAVATPALLPALAVAVGRGLAAPPPPPTGPPATL